MMQKYFPLVYGDHTKFSQDKDNEIVIFPFIFPRLLQLSKHTDKQAHTKYTHTHTHLYLIEDTHLILSRANKLSMIANGILS